MSHFDSAEICKVYESQLKRSKCVAQHVDTLGIGKFRWVAGVEPNNVVIGVGCHVGY